MLKIPLKLLSNSYSFIIIIIIITIIIIIIICYGMGQRHPIAISNAEGITYENQDNCKAYCELKQHGSKWIQPLSKTASTLSFGKLLRRHEYLFF